MKRTISLILSLIILIGAFSILPASAKKKSKTHTSGKYTYIVKNGTAKLTSYSGKEETVKLPNKLGKYKLTEIDEYAINNSKTKTVVIPKTVKKIIPFAFGSYGKIKKISVAKDNKYYSSDKSGVLYNKKKTVLVYFPINKKVKSYTAAKTVKEIGESAFDGAYYLKNVNLPEGLKKIGLRSFGDCKIKSINFPSTLQEIGELAFIGCKFKSLAFPASLKVIGKRAFVFDDDVTSVTLNEGLEQINSGAFAGNALTSVTIPSTVKKLSLYAFDCKKLKSYNVSEANPNYSSDDGVLYNKNKTTIIAYPNAKAIPDNYKIPDGVKKIGTSVFEDRKIKSVTFPETLEEIGNYAFEDCNNLTELNLSQKVKKLGEGAFSFCGKLKTVKCGAGLREIGKDCFDECENISKVEFNEGLKTIGESSFNECNIDKLNFKNGLEKIGDNAFSGASISSVKFPNTLKYLSGFDMTNLKKVDVPASVEVLGDECFSECPLKKVTLHNGLKKIGYEAFYDSYLKSINIPSSVTEIGADAFVDTRIKKITLPKSLKKLEIADSDFGTFPDSLKTLSISKKNKYFSTKNGILYNKKMTKILFYPRRRGLKTYRIPKSVKSIPANAFSRAEINKVIVGGKIKRIGKYAFAHCEYIKTMIIKKGVKSIAPDAFYFGNVYNIKLPNTIKKIEANTFYACSVDSINIPRSVKSIGANAFFGSGLGKITVPPTVKKIGTDAIGIVYGECGSYGGVNKSTIIRCKKNSAAYKYAKKQKVKYELY